MRANERNTRFRLLLLSGILLTSFLNSFSQTNNLQLTGTVSSAENASPLSGVTVNIKGASGGVITDEAGKFKLSASSNATLVFSYIGYASLEEKVGGRNVINISLALAGKISKRW